MHLRRYSPFVLALALISCSSTPTPSGEGASANAPRGNRDLIVRGELDTFRGRSAREVVQQLRPSWLRGDPLVAVDGTIRGGLEELDFLNSNNIESIQRLLPRDTVKYSLAGEVIEVTTRFR